MAIFNLAIFGENSPHRQITPNFPVMQTFPSLHNYAHPLRMFIIAGALKGNVGIVGIFTLISLTSCLVYVQCILFNILLYLHACTCIHVDPGSHQLMMSCTTKMPLFYGNPTTRCRSKYTCMHVDTL